MSAEQASERLSDLLLKYFQLLVAPYSFSASLLNSILMMRYLITSQDNRACHRKSRDQLCDHFSGDVGKAEVAALKFVGEPRVIHAQKVEHRRVKVMYWNRVFSHVVA